MIKSNIIKKIINTKKNFTGTDIDDIITFINLDLSKKLLKKKFTPISTYLNSNLDIKNFLIKKFFSY